jgi:hypothetical protein
MNRIGAGLFAVAMYVTSAAAEPVDLELVLLADASGSIDSSEIRFQRQGYVDALASDDVLLAIKDGLHGRIAITYVEWADQFSQHAVVPWMDVATAEDVKRFSDALLAAPREARGRNAIGSALFEGARMIVENDHDGIRKVIDFSGDSANNHNGLAIAEGREAALSQGITINGLAILCRDCPSGRAVSYDLEKAFEEQIIGGNNAFVITASGPDEFRMAVKRKLVLEIAGGEVKESDLALR